MLNIRQATERATIARRCAQVEYGTRKGQYFYKGPQEREVAQRASTSGGDKEPPCERAFSLKL